MNDYKKYLKYKYKYIKLKKQLAGFNEPNQSGNIELIKVFDKDKDKEQQEQLKKYESEFNKYEKKIIENTISNSNLLIFIIKFISEKDVLQSIILHNREYIDNIDINAIDYSDMKFKILLNEVIQWLIFDYDKDFFNIIINIITNIIYKFNFDKSDKTNTYIQNDNTKLNIIIFTIIDIITKLKEDNEKISVIKNTVTVNNNNNIILLQILIKVITYNLTSISYFLLSINENYNKNKGVIVSKNVILCLLQNILNLDISTNKKVKEIIGRVIKDHTKFKNYKDPEFYKNIIEVLYELFGILKCSKVITDNSLTYLGKVLGFSK
jgi:hypothetical protein